VWSSPLNSIPSSINFNFSSSVYQDDCLLVGLWKGTVQVFSIDDGKTIGRIHSNNQTSISAVGLIQHNQQPFIITGHANGSLGWYSSRCGTQAAETGPTGKTIDKICQIKDSIFVQGANSVDLWGKQGSHTKHGQLFTPGTGSIDQIDQNYVIRLHKCNEMYIVIYKHGYISSFMNNDISSLHLC